MTATTVNLVLQVSGRSSWYFGDAEKATQNLYKRLKGTQEEGRQLCPKCSH
jgi:hypothetical protein